MHDRLFFQKSLRAPDEGENETLGVFKEMIAGDGLDYKIHNISVDNGGEFKGVFAAFCESSKINLYKVQGTAKNSIVERFIQTLKAHILRYTRNLGEHRWVDGLPSIIESYNKSVHRSIGMAPNTVSVGNSHVVYKKLFPGRRIRRPSKFCIGDIVSYSKTFQPRLQKPYEGRWSLAVFQITSIKYTPRGSLPMYHLAYAASEQPFGDHWWYGRQLQKVDEKTFAGRDMGYNICVFRPLSIVQLAKI